MRTRTQPRNGSQAGPRTKPKPAKVQLLDTFSRLWQDNPDKRIFVVYGGAGSGKSMAVAQRFCRLLCEGPGLRMLVARKTLPSLRITAYQLIKDTLAAWNIPYTQNKNERTITYGPNQIYFTGLDDREKIKSAEFNFIWIEEATDIGKKDFLQLNLRLRRPHPEEEADQMVLTFNPIDAHHWLIEEVIEAPPNPKIVIHHSTYHDNPFLDQTYVDELEALEEKDANFYRIYTLGLPGVLENLIYKNFRIEAMPAAAGLMIRDADALGLDFGFNNQTGLVAVRFYEGRFYIKELFYKAGYTNQDLVAWMQEHLPNKNIPIWADSAEPDRIEEIARAGFNIWPANKQVFVGIDYLKAQALLLDPDSPNLITEFRNYKWREDKEGRVLDEPVKFRDHLVDAARYAIYTMNAGGAEIPVTALVARHKIPDLTRPGGPITEADLLPEDQEDQDPLDMPEEDDDAWDIPGLEV
jgi:phage terminase large subunit